MARDKAPQRPLPYGLRFGMAQKECARRLKAGRQQSVGEPGGVLTVKSGKGFGWPHGAVRIRFSKAGLQQVTAARIYPSRKAADKALAATRKPFDGKLTAVKDQLFGSGYRYDEPGHRIWLAVDEGGGFGKATRRPTLVFAWMAGPSPLNALHKPTLVAVTKVRSKLLACAQPLVGPRERVRFSVTWRLTYQFNGMVDAVARKSESGTAPGSGLKRCWKSELETLRVGFLGARRQTRVTLQLRR